MLNISFTGLSGLGSQQNKSVFDNKYNYLEKINPQQAVEFVDTAAIAFDTIDIASKDSTVKVEMRPNTYTEYEYNVPIDTDALQVDIKHGDEVICTVTKPTYRFQELFQELVERFMKSRYAKLDEIETSEAKRDKMFKAYA